VRKRSEVLTGASGKVRAEFDCHEVDAKLRQRGAELSRPAANLEDAPAVVKSRQPNDGVYYLLWVG
jgi:hypothetical protein